MDLPKAGTLQKSKPQPHERSTSFFIVCHSDRFPWLGSLFMSSRRKTGCSVRNSVGHDHDCAGQFDRSVASLDAAKTYDADDLEQVLLLRAHLTVQPSSVDAAAFMSGRSAIPPSPCLLTLHFATISVCRGPARSTYPKPV